MSSPSMLWGRYGLVSLVSAGGLGPFASPSAADCMRSGPTVTGVPRSSTSARLLDSTSLLSKDSERFFSSRRRGWRAHMNDKLPPLSLASARRALAWSKPIGFCVSNMVSSATGLPPQTMLNLAAGSYHGIALGTLLFVISATIGGLLGLLVVRGLLRDRLLRSSFMQPHRPRWEVRMPMR